jgi:hypothetical protein
MLRKIKLQNSFMHRCLPDFAKNAGSPRISTKAETPGKLAT